MTQMPSEFDVLVTGLKQFASLPPIKQPDVNKMTFAVNLLLDSLSKCEIPAGQPRHDLMALACYFTNLVCMSHHGTTDKFLPVFANDPFKQMFLYSARNSVQLDAKKFFDFDAGVASVWFSQYLLPLAGIVSQDMNERVVNHYRSMDPRCGFMKSSTRPFFWVDYVDPLYARKVKTQLADSIELLDVAGNFHPQYIAVITDNWIEGNVVYRITSEFVKALARKYKVTLIHAGALPENHASLDLFDRVCVVCLKDNALDLAEIRHADFAAAIYLDVGMRAETILLANCRLAPIQIACAGHGVSTFSRYMDYYISGEEVEREGAASYYREKLVLLPGLGVQTLEPVYKPPQFGLSDIPTVMVPWSSTKYNASLANQLYELSGSMHLQLLPGANMFTAHSAFGFTRDLTQRLGANVEITDPCEYTDYMDHLAKGSFSLDSCPFGGYASIIDALYAGIPVAVFEGERWTDRAAAAVMRRLNLSPLVANSQRDLFRLARKLGVDRNFRREMTKQVRAADLAQKLFYVDETAEFVRAIDYILAAKPQHSPVYMREVQ